MSAPDQPAPNDPQYRDAMKRYDRPTDTEDKAAWCAFGEELERRFVAVVAPAAGIGTFRVNPEKGTDRYAIDLVELEPQAGQLVDLKHQATPFFRAGDLYGVDPQHAWAFNVKDAWRYATKYPRAVIVVWLEFAWPATVKELAGKRYTVEPFAGVYYVPFGDLLASILSGRHPVHHYGRRQAAPASLFDAGGNATGSYIIDPREHATRQREAFRP